MEQEIVGAKPRRGRKPKQPAAAKPPAKPRKKREPRPTPMALKALELMNSGQARTITAAAAILGCSREALSRAMNRPECKAHIFATAKLEAATSVGYAMRQKLKLLDATSEKVRSEVCSEVLAIGGNIMAPRPAAVNVEINNRTEDNRYVLNLTGFPEAAVVDELMRDPALLDGGLTLGKGSMPRLEQLANEGHIKRAHEAAMSAAPAAERPQLEPYALLPDSRWVRPVGNRA